MAEIARILAPDGVCLIRIPVSSSEAWKKYGIDWGSIDAPRHYYLHTPKSMQILAEGAGLEIMRTNYDSSHFQFWASELYKRDISIAEAEKMNPAPFSKRQIEEFERRAETLNAPGRGDFAAFYLRCSHRAAQPPAIPTEQPVPVVTGYPMCTLGGSAGSRPDR